MHTIDVSVRSVHSLTDALRMAAIRNSGRANMTNDRSHIGWLRQTIWYFRRYYFNRTDINGYLLDVDRTPIGYGLLTWRRNKWWVTGVILPQQRHRGWGEFLFRYMTETSPKPVYLEVLKSNLSAIRLYTRIGYKVHNETKDRWVMRYG